MVEFAKCSLVLCSVSAHIHWCISLKQQNASLLFVRSSMARCAGKTFAFMTQNTSKAFVTPLSLCLAHQRSAILRHLAFARSWTTLSNALARKYLVRMVAFQPLGVDPKLMTSSCLARSVIRTQATVGTMRARWSVRLISSVSSVMNQPLNVGSAKLALISKTKNVSRKRKRTRQTL